MYRRTSVLFKVAEGMCIEEKGYDPLKVVCFFIDTTGVHYYVQRKLQTITLSILSYKIERVVK